MWGKMANRGVGSVVRGATRVATKWAYSGCSFSPQKCCRMATGSLKIELFDVKQFFYLVENKILFYDIDLFN